MRDRHHFGQPHFHHMHHRRPPMFFPVPLLFLVLGIMLWTGMPFFGILAFLIPMGILIAIFGCPLMAFLNNSEEVPHKAKRKNGSPLNDYFESEPADHPNMIRTTDGKRYIRTESGEYKEVVDYV